MLLKGPRGPGRFGGGGAPRGAGRWPEDILLGAVGLGGGDLGRGGDVSADCERIYGRYERLQHIYLRPLPPTHEVSTGGGTGTVTVVVEMSPMIASASFRD